MRKLTTLALAAASTLAVALPAAAQQGYPYGDYDRRYGSGYEYGYGYDNGQRLITEAERLRRQIDIDRQQGRMTNREYNKFKGNIDSFRTRVIRVRDRYRGGMDPTQSRELEQDLNRLQRWYYDFQRENPDRYAYGYGNEYGGYPYNGAYGRDSDYPYGGVGGIGGIINDILRGSR